jgi:hypothetical protein
MSLQEILDKIFVTPESVETLSIIRHYGSKCESIVEFGSRGGISTIAAFQALLDTKRSWRPRFVAVDLVEDDSIKKLNDLALQFDISFHFYRGHSRQYALHECDALIWDTFHTGGGFLADIERMEPWIHKYIFVLGTRTDGDISEVTRRKLDCATVARELQISEEGARQGLKPAIVEFLKRHGDWCQVREFGEITVLERIQLPKSLFPVRA